jgi:hypothetical protein
MPDDEDMNLRIRLIAIKPPLAVNCSSAVSRQAIRLTSGSRNTTGVSVLIIRTSQPWLGTVPTGGMTSSCRTHQFQMHGHIIREAIEIDLHANMWIWRMPSAWASNGRRSSTPWKNVEILPRRVLHQTVRPMFTGLFRSPVCSRFSSCALLGSFRLSSATALPTARVALQTHLSHPLTSRTSSSGLIPALHFQNTCLSMATYLYSSPCSYWVSSCLF